MYQDHHKVRCWILDLGLFGKGVARMLEKLDLTQKLGKKEYKRVMPELENRLYTVEKASWDAGIPVIILFEGWDAAGKGTSIQGLTSPLDPRGFKLYPIRAARTYEKKRPWLWRFWLKLPARGEWAIFDRSWYGRVMVERVNELIPETDWRRAYRDIVDFERTIADDGHVIIKFFLHISKQEQKRRFEKLVKDPLSAWHVEPEDWENHRRYDQWLLAYEEAFERTDTEWGPWTIVEATDRRYTKVKIYRTIVTTLEERLGIIYQPEDAAAEEGESPGTEVDAETEEPGSEAAEDEVSARAESMDESPADLVLPTAQRKISEGLPEATD
jgi:polyphosphate kinase 2 (PPK2 family)